MFACQHGDGLLRRVSARRHLRRQQEKQSQAEENPIWADVVASLEFIFESLEDLDNGKANVVGKLSNLLTTLGCLKSLLVKSLFC